MKYLGYIISEEELRSDPKLTKAIENYPTPQNVSHVKSFLGLSRYYRKFIWDYANKARPLTILTRQKRLRRWGPTEEEAFQFLKTCLLEDAILRFPNFDLEFIVQTDASLFTVGSVFDRDTRETTDKEAYAIYHANPYLYGT